MDRVEARKQAYKQVSVRLDPDYEQTLDRIEVVKKFIADRGGVIYGGTAIDYALRLRGDSIYDDSALDIPDLDFFLADNVASAYDLADILYEAGSSEARAIVAIHVEAMRVDSGNNHFIADIAYMPMLDKIPTVTYSGMKCVHPDYQRCDLHSSLAFPFDNAPREVIFDRWKKDIERLNKIDASYPLDADEPSSNPVTETHRFNGGVIYGWAAFCALVNGRGKRIAASLRHTKDALIFNTARGMEYVTVDEPPTDATKYYGYANLVFPRAELGNTTYYSTADRKIATVRIGKLQCVCAQAVLHYMIGMWFFSNDSVYLAAYCDLWELVKEHPKDPSLGLSVETYGDKNINHAQIIHMKRIRGEAIDGLPRNYRPETGKRPEPFGYASEYYLRSAQLRSA